MQKVDKKFFDTFAYNKNLIICGNVGVGKTHTALKLLSQYQGKSEHKKAWTYKISDAKFKELVGSQRMGHKPHSESSYDNYPLEMLIRCEVILFDDIGVTDVTDTYLRKLTYILDERQQKGRMNIFTTNLSAEELQEKLNERIVSRLLHNTIVVVMEGEDKRRATTEIVTYENECKRM